MISAKLFLLVPLASAANAVVIHQRGPPPPPPAALPQKATYGDLKWQPSVDFDKDGCFNVPAIDAQGNVAVGLPHEYTGTGDGCRDESDLDNNNVYVRARCNHGWCGHVYGYYFEKDVATPNTVDLTGHTNDWEHAVVWVNNDVMKHVGLTQHTGCRRQDVPNNVRLDQDTHVKIVYNKDGGLTHDFRFAAEKDDKIENPKGVWFRGALVSWNGFPGNTRDILAKHNFGSAHFALADADPDRPGKDNFADVLNLCMPDEVKAAHFDAYVDDASSPGNP